MAELFLSTYSKECPTESNQLQFYINLFKDIKTANTILKISLDSDIKSLDLFTKALSNASLVFTKELKSLTGNDENFINLCIDFCKMFNSLSESYNEKFTTFNSETQKELEDNRSSLSRITQYILDLNNSSLKELSNTRVKYKGAVNKRDKSFKDFEALIKKFDDTSIITDKIISSYCEYIENAENTKAIYLEAKESEEYMEKCLMNNLLNSTCCFVDYFNKIKNIFILLIKLKTEFYEKCNQLVSSFIDKFPQNPINITEFESKYLISNEINNFSIEDMKSLLKTNPESNEINNYLDSLILAITQRKNIISHFFQFLTSAFKSYDVLYSESKKKGKLYQFKAQYCFILDSTFITKMLNFLCSLNELFITKSNEFIMQNPLIMPSIEGIIKELQNEESYLTSCNTRLKKEVAILISTCEKGPLKSDIIEESYAKFQKYTEEFIENISGGFIRLADLTKAVNSLKSNSIETISKQIKKLFEILFDFTKVSESVITTDFHLEDNTKKVIGEMLSNNKINDDILNDVISYAVNFNNQKQYCLKKLPDGCLIKQEDKVINNELKLPNELNEAQVKELKEKSERKSIKRTQSNKKTDFYARYITFELKENEKVEEQQTKIALIDNLLVLGFILKINKSYLYLSAYNNQSYSLDLKSIELTSDDNCIKFNTNTNKPELVLIQDKTTEQFLSKIAKEMDRLKKAVMDEEFINKQSKLFTLPPNIQITKTKLKEIMNKITEISLEGINKKEILHKQFKEHYITDQFFKCEVTFNNKETKELPIPIYLIFNILYNPQYCSKAFPNYDFNFIRSLQNLRNDYDVVFTETDFSLDKIPQYYIRKADETFNMFSKFPNDEIKGFINECKKYPLVQEYNYTYYHPIPNPIIMGPKLLQINETYKIVFVSPICFIVEIKSSTSGFMLLDSFYCVVRYRFDAEYDDNLIICNTKINVEFTIDFVKEVWLKNRIETNGYSENETYITTFTVPNMIKELEINGKELYSKYISEIAKVIPLSSKQIESSDTLITEEEKLKRKRNLFKPYSRTMLYPIMMCAFLLFIIFQHVFKDYLGNNGLYFLLFVILAELIYLSSQIKKLNESEPL